MSWQFKVGEVAIHKPDVDSDPDLLALDGEWVEVIGPIGAYHAWDGVMWGYEVRHPTAGDFYCEPRELRRKPPAADSGERTFMELVRKLAETTPQKVGEPA